MEFFDRESMMDAVRAQADESLEKNAREILIASQELVPRGETGILRESGYFAPDEENQTSYIRTFKVAYDTSKLTGKPFNYAIIRHEIPAMMGYGSGTGQTKFLEFPFKAIYGEVDEEVRSALWSGVEMGVTKRNIEI